MRLLTVAKLTEDLWRAADILRGSIDASEYLEIVSRILILKRASDQPGFLRVPDRAQWSHIVVYPGKELGHVLDEALRQLEHNNPEVLDGVMDGYDLSRRLGPAQLQALVDHFSNIPLDDDHLEFSDAVGLAYNHALRWFGEQAGKKGRGILYTRIGRRTDGDDSWSHMKANRSTTHLSARVVCSPRLNSTSMSTVRSARASLCLGRRKTCQCPPSPD